jgi:hypothetical protein
VINQTHPIILEQYDEENDIELNDQTNKPSSIEQINPPKKSNQPSHVQTSYPKRLNIDKSIIQLDFDFLGEFKRVCVRIPLFQAIRYVPIYARDIK